MLPNLGEMTKSLQTYMQEEGIERVALIRFDSAWGKELGYALQDIMDATGGEFVREEVYNKIGGNTFATEVTKIGELDVDAVFVDVVGPDVSAVLKSIKEQGVDISVYGYESIEDEYLSPGTDKTLFVGTTFVDYSGAIPEELSQQYAERYGKAPRQSADKSYQALFLLAQALEHEHPQTYLATQVIETPIGPVEFRGNIGVEQEVLIKTITETGIQELEVVTIKEEEKS